MTSILPADSPEAHEAAARALAAGGLIVLPTDTLYGIAARLDRPAALDALFVAKARPPGMALPVLVASAAGARSLGAFSPAADALASAWWPGALTLVVPRRAGLDAPLGGDGATIGLRVPAREDTRVLLERTGPLATTSANRSGAPTPRLIGEIVAVFGEGVAVYLDGGPAPGGLGSTVVSVVGERPQVLREGALPAAEALAVLA